VKAFEKNESPGVKIRERQDVAELLRGFCQACEVKTMSVKNCWLVLLVSAAAVMVVFGYGGVALAQAPTPAATPGFHNPPGWKPHVAYPFSHHLTREQEMRLRQGERKEEKALREHGGIFPQGRQPPPTAAYTPSPEMLQQMRAAEENSRKHLSVTVSPPHVDKHWGTANGRPPERYHRTAPPTPSSRGGRADRRA
jgi:hypothetical protein